MIALLALLVAQANGMTVPPLCWWLMVGWAVAWIVGATVHGGEDG